MNTAPILIMAGGTGGHIFPGIAVAQELQSRNIPVLWLGSVGGLETRLVPNAGLPIETLNIGGIRGKGWRTLIGAPLRIARAILAAWRLMRRVRPRSCGRGSGRRPADRLSDVVHRKSHTLISESNSSVFTGFAI